MNTKIAITNVVLKTDRLTLRPWWESDLADFYEHASSSERGDDRC